MSFIITYQRSLQQPSSGEAGIARILNTFGIRRTQPSFSPPPAGNSFVCRRVREGQNWEAGASDSYNDN